nr:MAG TPA: hypothetical protein [Caudoviricetes sp.]
MDRHAITPCFRTDKADNDRSNNIIYRTIKKCKWCVVKLCQKPTAERCSNANMIFLSRRYKITNNEIIYQAVTHKKM